ncbi:hypothetical protein Tco_1533875 [Tanacetum coccineum]
MTTLNEVPFLRETDSKATAKVQNDNEEVKIQALVDGKKVIITETSVRRALHLKDAKGTDCLPTATIFAELERMGKVNGPIEPIIDEATNEDHVSTPSYDPSQSGEDRMQLNKLMDLCAKLSDRVLVLENTNTSQAADITTLKERVKMPKKKWRSRTYNPRRLYKVGLSRRIDSFDDASLGAQEDSSKQGRKIANLDADTEPMVNTATTTSSIPVSATDPVTTAGEVVTTASVEILEELTLA